MPFDYDRLRKDVLEFCGDDQSSDEISAPDVEGMDESLLFSYACSKGFDMRKYDTPDYSDLSYLISLNKDSGLYSAAYITKEIADSVPLSEKTKEIIETKPSHWEHLLVAGCMEDNFKYLSALKKQSKNNPIVRLTGDRGEGFSTLGYAVGIFDCIARETDLIVPCVNTVAPDFEKGFGKDGEDGNPEILVQTCRRYMVPYISLLGLYSDIRSAKSSFPKVLDELAAMVESMLDDCEQFYKEIITNIRKAVNGEKVPLHFILELSGFSTDELTELIEKDREAIAGDKIRRRKYIF